MPRRLLRAVLRRAPFTSLPPGDGPSTRATPRASSGSRVTASSGSGVTASSGSPLTASLGSPLTASLGSPRIAASRAIALLGLAVAAPAPLVAQVPLRTYADAFEMRHARTDPVLRYELSVAPRTPGFEVVLTVQHAPDTLRLALPIWAPGAYRVVNFARYVHDVRATGRTGPLAVVADSSGSAWHVAPGGDSVTVRYHVDFPSAAAAAASNRSFVRPDGALVDGPATYLAVVGHELAPAFVRFALPPGHRAVTGLVPTSDPSVFFAPSYDVLIDSPTLLGASSVHVWPFTVDGVPHRVAYWADASATRFDSVAFVDGVRRAVASAERVFGRLPYRDYTFIFIDGTGGGLEHLNSTTIGVSSAELAHDPLASIGTTAHEFFHLWNVKRIRPAVLGPFDYAHVVRTTDLWWSEGVTDYFAGEIVRRAGLTTDSASLASFADNLASFYGNPAHTRVSAERSSWTAWDPPSANGGYAISYYLQGAILGELLELQIRAATGNRRGMDDLARLMFDHYAGARGFTGEDLLNAANETCGCDLQPFFGAHVSGAEELDVDRYLGLAGMRAVVTRGPATTATGAARPDLRLAATAFGGIGSAGGPAGFPPRLSVTDPTTAWARAGLRSGDLLLLVNGRAIPAADDVAPALAAARIGDTVTVVVERDGARRTVRVPVAGYETVRVRLEPLPGATPAQLALRRLWLDGARTATR